MNNAFVKELIIRHFGEPKSSLMLGSAGKVGNQLYCYTLEEEKEISDICNFLKTQSSNCNIKLPALKQTFSKKEMKCRQLPQCACFEEQEDGY